MNPSAGTNAPPLRGRIVRAAFAAYSRLLSPILHAVGGSAGACRFQPTCSEYAALAIETHGLVRGAVLAIGRLARCHPFHPPAYDPVPTAPDETQSSPAMHTSPPPVTIEQAASSAIPSPR